MRPVQCHGVLLRYLGVGICLMGESGVGKSETALALLYDGAKLIADDIILLNTDGERVVGTCPQASYGKLAVHGLGILEVDALFGIDQLQASHPIDMIVSLEKHLCPRPEEALYGAWREGRLGEVALPCFHLAADKGRHIPMLVKTAIKQWQLTTTKEQRVAAA